MRPLTVSSGVKPTSVVATRFDQNVTAEFLRDRTRLCRVYETLHGNGRGLEFFAAAIQGMNSQEEESFLHTLAEVEMELQTNMALEQIVSHLGEQERELLRRLPAYQSPVPVEGIIKIGLDLSQEPDELLRRLLDVSLVEQHYAHEWQVHEYQCSPLVAEWLQTQGVPAPGSLGKTSDISWSL